MTGRERIHAAIAAQPVDRLPLMAITMMFASDLAGSQYRDYASDHRVLVEAQLRVAETFGFDYVSAISDPAREASDLGAAVQWFDNQPPAIDESRALFSDKSRLSATAVPSPGPRMSDRIQAVRLLSERAGKEKMVEGWVEGPCAMAADLRGLNTLMLDFHDDEFFVTDLFEFVVAMEIEFARQQIQAGAELIGVGDAAASLVGPKIYQRFVLPYEKKLVSALHELGARVRLHICGNTRKILGGMGQTGCEIVDLDYPSPLHEARAAMGPRQVLLGNIDPVRVLRDGTQETVTAAVEQCWREAQPRYIVGAGCEVPRGTPHANVHAMAQVAAAHV